MISLFWMGGESLEGRTLAACRSRVKAEGSLTSETPVTPPLRANTPRRTGDRRRPARGLWGLLWK